jgi:hypothetical protein
MSTDWRKMGLFLVGVGGLYVLLVGVAADFAQVLSLKYGWRLLVLLLVATLGYKVWEQGRRLWRNYCALQARLDEACDFIMRSGERSAIVLLCARTLWLFQQPEQSIRVSGLRTDGLVMLDVSQVSLRPGHLLGMHFTIMGSDTGEKARGTVKSCDPAQACIELYDRAEAPCVGDLAIPIEPPDATDLERLLGNVLFIVSE